MKVFITGASSGIGAALARQYANQGATLGLAARRIDALSNLAASFTTPTELYSLDVTDAQALQSAAQDFIQRFGCPDIVIANAGISRGTLTENLEDIAAFKKVFEVNAIGLVNTFQPFISAMKSAGGGQLVGIASVAGVRGLPGAGAYSASKAAAINYLESLRVELIHDHITVTTIAPGYIRTPMTNINDYNMPFLMDVDIAAQKMVKAIHQRKRFTVIPWQMGWVACLIRILPTAIWDLLMKNAPRKKRFNLDE